MNSEWSSTREERLENGDVIVTVADQDEFLKALTYRPEVDGHRIKAPAKVGFAFGGDGVVDGSA